MNPQYENLINSLVSDGYLKTPEIIDAFKAIDRADFVLEEHKKEAYVNAALPIGSNQTISQPLTVAFMLEILAPKTGEKILDVGSGSGWKTALLAQIVGKSPSDGGKVIGIERIPELKEMAEKNISKYNFLQEKTAEVILGDGSKGYEEEAPFDRIIVGATAAGEIPEKWKEQLKIGGRIVAPVNNSIVVIDKISKDKYEQKEHFGFSFVPLIEADKRR
ncbi:MAG TPA: protein-L-isoaspartate(D-aspartate) O-methyltransferase [Candidatus Wolfebacteria bacterium]|nr:protein-L-isoaspartate(D-aspartate) O-methyltransferase [Candidatus Wolfebacteria bacterium]